MLHLKNALIESPPTLGYQIMRFNDTSVEQTRRELPPYLPSAAKGVHVVEDGDEFPVIGWVQDVAINFKIFNHHIHHVRAKLQSYYVWPACLAPLQRRS